MWWLYLIQIPFTSSHQDQPNVGRIPTHAPPRTRSCFLQSSSKLNWKHKKPFSQSQADMQWQLCQFKLWWRVSYDTTEALVGANGHILLWPCPLWSLMVYDVKCWRERSSEVSLHAVPLPVSAGRIMGMIYHWGFLSRLNRGTAGQI